MLLQTLPPGRSPTFSRNKTGYLFYAIHLASTYSSTALVTRNGICIISSLGRTPWLSASLDPAPSGCHCLHQMNTVRSSFSVQAKGRWTTSPALYQYLRRTTRSPPSATTLLPVRCVHFSNPILYPFTLASSRPRLPWASRIWDGVITTSVGANASYREAPNLIETPTSAGKKRRSGSRMNRNQKLIF